MKPTRTALYCDEFVALKMFVVHWSDLAVMIRKVRFHFVINKQSVTTTAARFLCASDDELQHAPNRGDRSDLDPRSTNAVQLRRAACDALSARIKQLPSSPAET